MSVTVNDPILAPSRITAKQVRAWYVETMDRPVPTAVADYLNELERLCGLFGFDMLLLAAQSSHETDNWQSIWWTGRRNPAGIGITGDPEQNTASQIWANGTDAARGHVVHMSVYLPDDYGNDPVLDPYVVLDKRFLAVVAAGYDGTVLTLNDLTGKWAVDPQYAAKIAARANDMIRGMEVHPVTTPTIYNLATDYARFGLTQSEANEVISSRFENRSQGGVTVSRPEFIVLHIQAGYTKGSLKYWSSPAVDASSTVMIQHDGTILNIIPEQHAPWTNGDDANPSAAGQRLVGLPGNSNLYTLSIEAEGIDGTDTTPAQLDSIVWQVETWMAKYGIPKANVLRHADINSVTRPNCPGAYYPIVMARIGATPPGPVYATPEAPAWFAASVQQAHPSDANVDGVRWFVLRRNFEALRNTNRYSKPDTSSPKSGPKILTREKIVCERYFKDAARRSWIVEPDGSYVTAAAMTPAVTIRSR